MGFSLQEYWSVLPFHFPGYLPDPGIEPTSLLQCRWILNLWATWEAKLPMSMVKTLRFNFSTQSSFLFLQSICIQFSSVTQWCLTLCDPMNHSTPGLPVYHELPGFTQTHGHWVSDAIQPSHPLSSPSPPALNPSQHQGLSKWVSSSQVAKVLEFQLQHQSFQWTPRTDLL